jgi:hypothetical protein
MDEKVARKQAFTKREPDSARLSKHKTSLYLTVISRTMYSPVILRMPG